MKSELAACPVPNCGRDVEVTEEGVFCICGYRLDDELEGMEGEPGVTTFERHNTLARRAEVGALVERIVDGLGYVQMECEADANGEAGMYDVRSHDASAYTDTLLDALRALAKECQKNEKP